MSNDSQIAVEYIAKVLAVEDAEQRAMRGRIRKAGLHCWYCGAAKAHRCSCGCGESFRCNRAGVNVCDACERAHNIIARHLESVFSFPKASRVDSRRAQNYKLLRQAAYDIAETDGRGLNETLGCCLDQADAYDETTAELRAVAYGAFREIKFVRFQELAAALERQRDNQMFRSTARLLKLLR